jgi:hypothetical protein
MLALNRGTWLGPLPEEPQCTFAENGTPQCASTVLMEGKSQEHTYRLYIPVDVFGDRGGERRRRHRKRKPYSDGWRIGGLGR